ncbi:hypothetical protein [Hyunsoonleella rubra]|uniref:Uncharacterized protein n=1 Tax=Hyunsoonleella rubra TaxID=1737062 RepID=A0ABW5TDB4_9FLAO
MKDKKLHNIKSTGFKVPKDYFDSFEASMLDKIQNERHLNDISSAGFKTPQNYFDTLESKVFKKLSEEKDTKVVKFNFRQTMIYISGVAAAVLIILNLPIFESNPSFDNLETETVENYIIDENISSYEIASLMSDEELNENDFVNYNLDKENIEEYLLNNADLESLMIE